MNALRSLAHWFCLLLLSIVLTTALAVLALSMNLTNPERIKSWPERSQLYGNLLGSITDVATVGEGNRRQSLSERLDQSQLDKTGINAAVREGLSPGYVQGQFEGVVDGIFAWLDGETPKPVFKFSLGGRSDKLAETLSRELQSQISRLPTCTPAQEARLATKSLELFDLNCRPQSADITQEIDRAIKEQTEEFKFAEYTGDDLESALQPCFWGSCNDQPNSIAILLAYSLLTNLPWILLAATVVLSVAAFFTAKSHRDGLRKLGWTYVVAGLPASSGYVVLSRVESLQLPLEQQGMPKATYNAVRTIAKPLVDVVAGDIARTGLLLSLATLLIGALLLIYGLVLKRHEKTPAEPLPESDSGVTPMVTTVFNPEPKDDQEKEAVEGPQ